MNINWVVASGYQLDPAVDVEILKNIGPIWGSWTTWRSCGTDNVICSNLVKATELVKRSFQENCNFFIPEKFNRELGRPTLVKLFGGEFPENVDNIDDIVGLHLATSSSEIALLLGFKLGPIEPTDDRLELHKIKNYYGLIHSLIAKNTAIQFVILDHPVELDKTFQNLTNLTCDTLGNVLQLLAQ